MFNTCHSCSFIYLDRPYFTTINNHVFGYDIVLNYKYCMLYINPDNTIAYGQLSKYDAVSIKASRSLVQDKNIIIMYVYDNSVHEIS